MSHYGVKNVQLGYLDEKGEFHDAGPIQDISWLSNEDTVQGVNLVKGEMPTVTLSFGPMSDKDYRHFLRVFGINWLWNGWQYVIRHFAGRN